MKAVYEHTPYLHGREKYYYGTPHSGESAIRKSASQQSKYLIKKYGSSDPIRSLAVMKMARSFLARQKKKKNKKKTVLARAISTPLYRTKKSYEWIEDIGLKKSKKKTWRN